MKEQLDTIHEGVKGVVVPLITPIDEKENVDFTALGRIVDHIIDGGCHGILVTGSASEFPRFSAEVRREIVRFVLEQAKGRITTYVAVSDSGTHNALKNLEWALRCGAQYIVSTLPYYFTQPFVEEQVQFFSDLADASSVPVLLYNIPQNVGATIELESIRRLADHPNILGVKDSQGKQEAIDQLLEVKKNHSIKVFVGKENLCVYGLRGGAAGIIPSTGNALPKIFTSLYRACQEENWEEAETYQHMADELNSLNQSVPSMIGHFVVRKTLMERFSLCRSTITRPVATLSDEAREAIYQMASKYEYMF